MFSFVFLIRCPGEQFFLSLLKNTVLNTMPWLKNMHKSNILECFQFKSAFPTIISFDLYTPACNIEKTPFMSLFTDEETEAKVGKRLYII
jgi:hypothetical protein